MDSARIEYLSSLAGISSEQLQGFCVGWRQPLSPEQLHQSLQNSSYVVFAFCQSEGRVVGFVHALSDEVNFAFIPMLEVLPEFQKQGIGTELVCRLFDQLKDIPCIDLMCDANMQSFYQRLGMSKSHGMIIRKYLQPNG